jgi:predicted nucleic acid-binding protein
MQVGSDAVSASIITLAELRYGAASSSRPAANQQAIDHFTAPIAVIGIEPAVATMF